MVVENKDEGHELMDSEYSRCHLKYVTIVNKKYNLQSRAWTHTVLVIGLYELLDPVT